VGGDQPGTTPPARITPEHYQLSRCHGIRPERTHARYQQPH
jgi:hypothetical protein